MSTKTLEPKTRVEEPLQLEASRLATPEAPEPRFFMTVEFWTLAVIAALALVAIIVAVLPPRQADTASLYGVDGKDLAIGRATVTSPYTIDGKDGAIDRATVTSPYTIDGKDAAIERGR